MARHTRMLSEQGVYHIVMKGINASRIFFEDNDYISFLKYFKDACNDYEVEILAYCVMDNHVHFILKFNRANMSELFKSFGAKFVPKYNANHSRIGPMFNGRYYSSPINDDRYLLSALRYIHYNPVKAGICKNLDDYRWSSYNDYNNLGEGITDTDYINGILSENDLKMLHIIDDGLLDDAFVFNSLINGVEEKEVINFIKRNENRQPEDMIEVLKRAKLPKKLIADNLKINRKHI